MLNRWVEDGLLDVLGDEGVGCIAFSPLAQGMLTDRYLHGVPADSRAAQGKSLDPRLLTEERPRARPRARRRSPPTAGQSLAQMALSWVLRDERVTSVLIGASSVAQLEANVARGGRPGVHRRRARRDRRRRRRGGHQPLAALQRRVSAGPPPAAAGRPHPGRCPVARHGRMARCHPTPRRPRASCPTATWTGSSLSTRSSRPGSACPTARTCCPTCHPGARTRRPRCAGRCSPRSPSPRPAVGPPRTTSSGAAPGCCASG